MTVTSAAPGSGGQLRQVAAGGAEGPRKLAVAYRLEKMGVCKHCCQGADSLDDIAEGRSRRCTDILCLLIFLASMTTLVILSVWAVDRDSSLLTDLVYPKDSYGNNCGQPGTATANLPKVFYPSLDTDILNQISIVASGLWWQFEPTKMCASSCPTGFSLSSPKYYGGDSYPVTSTTSGAAPGVWYAYETQDVVSRCFPKDTSSATLETELCSVPSCTNQTLNATLGGTLACYVPESQPDATNVWQICAAGTSSSLCTTQRAACELQVTEQRVDTFIPTSQTSDSETYTREFASYVQMVRRLLKSCCTAVTPVPSGRPPSDRLPSDRLLSSLLTPIRPLRQVVGAFESILVYDGYVTILIVGVTLPVLFGLGWFILLWLFAGPFVFLAILILFVIEITLCFWLMYQVQPHRAVHWTTRAKHSAADSCPVSCQCGWC